MTTNDAWGHELSRATFSPSGRFRYTLERRWADVPRFVLFIMLNPSTAGAVVNDATVRRCLGFARLWGFTGLLVGNLYAYIATNPRDLELAALEAVRRDCELDVIGPENAAHLTTLIARASLVVCAWGKVGPIQRAHFDTLQLLRPPVLPHYLRLNGNGEPGHPLRLPADLRPTPWDFFTRRRGAGDGP